MNSWLEEVKEGGRANDIPAPAGTPPPAAEGDSTYLCPECEGLGVKRLYKTGGALGIHRLRAHGVPGEKRRRNRKGRPPARAPVAQSRPAPLNDTALLREIFPRGIPAHLYERAFAWLAEARTLHAEGSTAGGLG